MAASVDQTAPATHAAANEQRWTKAQTKQSGCYLLDYTNKTGQEAGMYCWVQLYIIVNKTATGLQIRFLQSVDCFMITLVCVLFSVTRLLCYKL